MQTVLNTIIETARAAARAGQLKHNPYPAGTLRNIAYELGRAEHAAVALFSTQAGAETYAVGITADGLFECIVGRGQARHAVGSAHKTLQSAVSYLRDLAINHNASNILPDAA